MEFNNENLWPMFTYSGHTYYITQTLLATWIVMAVLVIFAIIARMRIKHFVDNPKSGSLQNVLELAVETVDDMAGSNLGSDLKGLGGYFFGVFAFILLANYTALFKLRPPTADFATTLALALTTFVLIHVLGIVRRKGAYFKDYLSPIFLFLPLNIISELARPVSLSFRLFGNILGGIIIMDLIYAALPLVLRFVIPDVLHAYLDVFVGALQSFIFTVLSMTFIKEKASLVED
jgi:F-type H+-transporting ATPase subunit a